MRLTEGLYKKMVYLGEDLHVLSVFKCFKCLDIFQIESLARWRNME